MQNAANQAGADEVLAKIATFPDDFRPLAERLHTIITASAPSVWPRLWYGMPGYAKTKGGPVVLFFRKDKYVSFGLTENADINVDSTTLVESAWFLTTLSSANEEHISSIARRVLSP